MSLPSLAQGVQGMSVVSAVNGAHATHASATRRTSRSGPQPGNSLESPVTGDSRVGDMDVTTLFSIGELSRRTGLSVRNIRFYSDSGVVAPTTRSPAGYRLYDLDALLRLELLCTLRELGMSLATIQRVLDRELSVAEVAAAHADAMDVQIRVLQRRRSVLRAVAGRGSNPEETKLMHRLTQLSGEERRRLLDDFVEGTFGTVDADPAAVAMVRAATPDLPEGSVQRAGRRVGGNSPSWSATRTSEPGCAGRPGVRPPGAGSTSRATPERN